MEANKWRRESQRNGRAPAEEAGQAAVRAMLARRIVHLIDLIDVHVDAIEQSVDARRGTVLRRGLAAVGHASETFFSPFFTNLFFFASFRAYRPRVRLLVHLSRGVFERSVRTCAKVREGVTAARSSTR
eukprot:62538-Prorocentrum_minimum.AAC.1